MIDKAVARVLVEAELNRLNHGNRDVEFVIMDDRTLERDFGWVFSGTQENLSKQVIFSMRCWAMRLSLLIKATELCM